MTQSNKAMDYIINDALIAAKRPKVVDYSVSVDTEVDVEIDLDDFVASLRDDDLEYVRSVMGPSEGDVNVAGLCEQVFYHYYGQEVPDCLRQLVREISGRIL